MSEYTKGPWTWRNAWISSDGMLNVRRLAGDSEATVAIPNADSETDIRLSGADAALIAAAPDLLEALRPFAEMEECEVGMQINDHHGAEHECPEFRQVMAARAAIAKAEGR
jgi:hypothetical protein